MAFLLVGAALALPIAFGLVGEAEGWWLDRVLSEAGGTTAKTARLEVRAQGLVNRRWRGARVTLARPVRAARLGAVWRAVIQWEDGPRTMRVENFTGVWTRGWVEEAEDVQALGGPPYRMSRVVGRTAHRGWFGSVRWREVTSVSSVSVVRTSGIAYLARDTDGGMLVSVHASVEEALAQWTWERSGRTPSSLAGSTD